MLPKLWHAVTACTLYVLAPALAAQRISPIEETYPFVASRAVASIEAVGGDPALTFAGFGGGVIVIDASDPNNLEKWNPHPQFRPDIRTMGGFNWDVAVDRDENGRTARLFVAAGIKGLERFTRDFELDQNFDLDFALPFVGDAHEVEVVEAEVDGVDQKFVLVGTADDTTRGRVWLLDDEGAVFDVWDVGAGIEGANNAGVFALAASSSVTNTPDEITVLVGSACSGIYRLGIPLSGADALTFGPPVRWLPSGGGAPYLRDVVIDVPRVPGGEVRRAWAADFRGKVHAFDVADGNLAEDTSSGWPISIEFGNPSVPAYLHSLALVKGIETPTSGTRLVVALGSEAGNEQLVYGNAYLPFPCDCAANGGFDPLGGCSYTAPKLGIQTWRGVDGGSTPALEVERLFDWGTSRLFHQIAARPRPGGGYFVDVANSGGGTSVFEATVPGGTWTMDEAGDFGEAQGVPAGSFDEVLVVGDVAYATTERNVFAFDLQASELFQQGNLAPPPATPKVALILASHGPGSVVLYASAQINGVTFYDVSSPLQPTAIDTTLATSGRCWGLRAVTGLGDPSSRWLYAANQNGTVEVFLVPDDPADPTAPLNPSRYDLLGTYEHPNTEPKLSAIDVEVVEVNGEHAVYVSVGPADGGDRRAGLLVLKAQLDAMGNVNFTLESVVAAVTVAEGVVEGPGRVRHDAATNRLYVGLGALGLARVDLSTDPFDPPPQDVHYRPSALVYDVLPIPTDRLVVSFPAIGDRQHGEIGILENVEEFESASIRRIPVPFQPVGMDLDPSRPASVFVTMGQNGIARIDLSTP